MKISKTLKRLRAEKGITQEQLAEMLFISRQSVSSWENDRTQPDLEMIGKLSEIFGVSAEELIYGKKRNVTLETKETNHNNTLIIVFSILGALLAGTGLALIFITFWQKMPLAFKAVLSLLPLIAGQAAGIFVLFKKKSSAPWCEGAGVLWSAGIGATLAMIYNVFNMGFYWEALLIVEALLIIPIVLLLKCVSPVTVFYGCTLYWLINSDMREPLMPVVLATILIGAGCVFTTVLTKKEKKSLRSICAQWVSVAAAVTFFVFLELGLSDTTHLLITAAGASGLCLLLISLKDSDIAMPYRIPGLIFTSLFLFGSGADYYGKLTNDQWDVTFTAVAILGVLITLGAVILTKTKIKDKFLLSYIGVGIITLIIFSVGSFFMPRLREATGSNIDEIFITLMKIVAIGGNILLMISGGREKKLLPINTGFVSVAALTFLIIYQSGLSMMLNGLLLLVAGVILLVINYKLSGKAKKLPTAEISGEVGRDE